MTLDNIFWFTGAGMFYGFALVLCLVVIFCVVGIAYRSYSVLQNYIIVRTLIWYAGSIENVDALTAVWTKVDPTLTEQQLTDFLKVVNKAKQHVELRGVFNTTQYERVQMIRRREEESWDYIESEESIIPFINRILDQRDEAKRELSKLKTKEK